MPYSNLQLLAPELWLCGLGLLVLVADMFRSRRLAWIAAVLALAGLALILAPTLRTWGDPPAADFMNSFVVDGFAVFMKVLFIVSAGLIVLLSRACFGEDESCGEFYSLLIFLTLGLFLLASANDLVLIYLAFELVSLTSYLFAAWRKRDRKSNEAGVKYFVYGAAASGVMVYGLSLIYGAGGTTNLSVIAAHLMEPTAGGGLALVAVLGVLLMTVGLGYKISMVPFHAWAPDVYEGAPTPVTALLSVGPKAAGFAVLLRVFFTLAPRLEVPWQVVFAVLATLTMFGGNLLALRQTNIKRLLAYSSIAHAGYLLIGLVVGPYEPWGISGVLVYLAAYLLMNLGLFAVAILIEREHGDSELSRFSGLAATAPGLAMVTVLLLLSLTGIPPTAGFVGKLYIFGAAIQSRQWAWLAVVGIINSVISLYYYMNIARTMYFGGKLLAEKDLDGEQEYRRKHDRLGHVAVMAVIGVTTFGTLALCVVPGWLIEAARLATMMR